ncbi:flagellin N-terminal helical domain-containing protein [Acidisoma sp. C75]
MSSVGSILTNAGALEALASIGASAQSNDALDAELSSGLEINSPADNPAGYITAQGLAAQVNGISQATSNANQGVSLLQTAQGALQQQISIVQRLSAIAVQAANGTQNPQEAQSLQAVASQLVSQVSAIATQTKFNNVNLLDGTFQNVQFQVGADEGQTLTVSIGDTQANALGLNQSAVNFTAAGNVPPSEASGPYNADNNKSSASGCFNQGPVAVSFGSKKVSWTGANGQTGSTNVTASESAASIAAAVNSTTAKTGVSAVPVTTYTFFASAGPQDAGFVFKLAGSGGTQVQIDAKTTQSLAQQINSYTGTTGITAALNSAGSQITLTQATGQNMALTDWTSASGYLQSLGNRGEPINQGGMPNAVIQGQVHFQSSAEFSLTNGSAIGLKDNSQLTSLSQIDLTTTAGANTAINVVNYALQALTAQGGALGAVQQRFQATISNLETAGENSTSALGVVQDANIPRVSNALTEAQIRAQTGVAALKNSTTLQQAYLSLLP